MSLKIKLTLVFATLFIVSFAQKKALESITANDLKAHLEFIASDYMQGREYSTAVPGLDITAQYLKSQCEKIGLKPGVEGYFQEIEMVSVKPDAENTMFVLNDKNGKKSYTDKTIFSLGGSPKSATLEGDIVFAGYGWYDDKTKYNDTKDIDLKDKIVMVMTRNIELAKSGEKGGNQIEMRKMQKAMMGGAKALIMIPDPMYPENDFLESIKKFATGGMLQLKGAKARSFIPVTIIFGNEKLANAVVKESGKTLAQLQKEINETGKPHSFVAKSVTAKIELPKITEPVTGKNVVAFVEGSDPALKDECVVFGAHYDHLGIDSKGEVYNGADDNGSGTVGLLEIAEAFQSMKKKPRRSVVFTWVTGEEKGLLGSAYYSQNPAFPLENTLTDINLDMIGRSAEKEPDADATADKSLAGPNGIYLVSGKQSSELMKISDKYATELGLITSDKLSKAFLQRSDYFHFYKNGIPILGVSTGLHDDYHKITDELDKIDFNKMERVARYCFLVGNAVANQKKRIVVDNPVKK